MTSIFMLGFFVDVHPMNMPVLNQFDKFNEVFSLILFYHLLFFTGWCQDFEIKYIVSCSFVCFLVVQILANVIIIIVLNLFKLVFRAIRRYFIEKERKRRQEYLKEKVYEV